MFITFAFIYLYDYTGGAAAALTGAAMLILASRWIEQAGLRIKDGSSLEAFLRRNFTPKGQVFITALRLLACSEGLVLNTLFAGYLLQQLFGILPLWTGVLVMLFTYIYAGVGGISGIRKVGIWLFVLMFTALMLIPVSVYLFKGISLIRLHLDALNLMQLNTGPLFIGCIAFGFLFLGKFMLNVLIYPEFSLIKSKRFRMAYQLTAVCWCALPLSGSVIFLYVLSIPSLSNSSSGSLDHLLGAIPGNLPVPILYLLTLFILASVVLGIGTSLYGMLSILQGQLSSFFNVNKIYAAASILCGLPLLAIPFSDQVIPASIMFYCHLFTASGLPLFNMWDQKKPRGAELAGGILFSTALGCIVSWYTSYWFGLIICVIIPSIVMRITSFQKTSKI